MNFSGIEEVHEKLEAILKLLKKSTDPNTLEEFKTFFKLLAFVACAGKAPIRQKMLDETLARVAKAGDAENIQRWSWWTPNQLGLLELAENLPRVILIGGNGTGKTVMLDAFATKIAKEHQEEEVIFAIHHFMQNANSLLLLDLEVKYENLKLENITVKNVEQLSELEEGSSTNFATCIDEISLANVEIEELKQIRSRFLWVVIRDSNTATDENSEEYLREQFPDWVIVNLSYPLRTSKAISEKVRTGEENCILHWNEFNASLQVPQNMPLGPESLSLPSSIGSYLERLQLAFNKVAKGKPALIILEYAELKPTPDEIQESKTNTSYQELAESNHRYSQNYLVAIEAVKACQRSHHPPLLWFQSEHSYLNDSKEVMKEWMRGRNKNIASKDIITDDFCVAGYEANIVIFLGSAFSLPTYMSRCRVQFVHIE